MKHLLTTTFAAGFLILGHTAFAADPTTGSTDLFASGDFSQWTKHNGAPVSDAWTIQDGVIHRGGIKPGDIITKKHYSNFELTFDWKISKGGNSGVKYRTKGKYGLEYQVLDDEGHKNGKDPLTRAAAMYALFPRTDDKPVKPAEEWNNGRIVAKDNQIEHWLNGSQVLKVEIGSEAWNRQFKKSKYKNQEGFGNWTGPILLQDHGNKVWFRNVKIREL